jgi:hypothetical protein
MAKQKTVDDPRGPEELREFTSKQKGGHGILLQSPEFDYSNGKTAPRPIKRAITATLQFGVKFDPYVECGEGGKNRHFRDITPQSALAVLLEKTKERESPVIFWKDRPMGDDEKEFERRLRTEKNLRLEQQDENAKLRDLIASAGIKVPADL